MTPSTLDRRTWVMTALRAGYGAALVLRPQRLLSLGDRSPVPAPAVAVARILGARHLMQCVVTAAVPARRMVVAGAVVDAVHGCSELVVAAMSPRRRGAALTDAAVAALLAALAAGSALAVPRPLPRRKGRR